MENCTIVKNAGAETNNITQQWINQVKSEGEKEIERVAPKILRGAIEEVYQMPFRLLGKFGNSSYRRQKKDSKGKILDSVIISLNCIYNKSASDLKIIVFFTVKQ